MKRIIVAIDGPAASGKSTTAKLLANKLGYIYLDTGAMYRACALQSKYAELDLTDIDGIATMMENIDLKIQQGGDGNIILLNGQDISSEIRTPEISALASSISAIPAVRVKMVELQRKLGAEGGVVLDGRDIGTVVFPLAEAKFYLIADLHERAKRRHLELLAKGIETPFTAVLEELSRRDKADAERAMAPLKPADDAIQVDTSELSIQEQVDLLYRKISVLLGKAPQIRLARHSGYCFGVRRAIQMALEASQTDKQVYTLGEIIHNPGIVHDLETKGIRVAKDASELKNSVVIIRSHGITKDEMETLKTNGNEIIDATCPYVNRTHELMQKLVLEDYPVLILGDSKHPEVIGMLSYGDERTKVVSADSEIPPTESRRLALISQTTQKLNNLEKLACKLLSQCLELRVFNTICLATSQRQEATVELAKASDAMLIIGGFNSANTRALAALSESYCPTYHIEDDVQLNNIDLSGFEKIGLAAGASTPEEIIIKVYNRVLQKSGIPDTVRSIGEIPMFKEESC
jgi:(E)-4-hydroxy-3-methyl-but-2-enyl pyrophosphate reductase/cytidylate kinase